MENVLDVYERPYNPTYPVVNLDESPFQLVSQTHQDFTDSQGVRHIDYEYKREGVVDLSGSKPMLVVHDDLRTFGRQTSRIGQSDP